ncbi:MAG: hypothetical protein AAFO62_02005 [Pseudomonadota bacterium]
MEQRVQLRVDGSRSQGRRAEEIEGWQPVGGLLDQILARMTIVPDAPVAIDDVLARKAQVRSDVAPGTQYEFGLEPLAQAA